MLAKFKLNNIKALFDSDITHNGFVLTNNMMKESYDLKEEIKKSHDN